MSVSEIATEDDIRKIRDMLSTIKDFISDFVKDKLDYLILDPFADLLDDIKSELPRIEEALNTVNTHLVTVGEDVKGFLYKRGLTGSQLRLKFETIKRSISLVKKYSIIKDLKRIRTWVFAAFKAINDSLGSLKEAFSAIPAVSMAIGLTQEFKGHLENVTTVATE